jgi:hypothetical protein
VFVEALKAVNLCLSYWQFNHLSKKEVVFTQVRKRYMLVAIAGVGNFKGQEIFH